MAEFEAPIEKLQEHLHEAAHHAQDQWISRVALFSTLVAVVAAVSALMAEHHSNEAVISQIKSSDTWGYYQAKGIKSAILQMKTELLPALGKQVEGKDADKLKDYRAEQDEIFKEAHRLQAEARHHLETHQILARAVTLFQVAIALAAITVLARRKKILFASLAVGLGGFFFLIQGLLN